jgi:hypothetical protein
MRLRTILAALAALVALGQTGCALVPTPVVDNPLIVPACEFDKVWATTVGVVDNYFDIRTENRLARRIETDPDISPTLAEPWRLAAVGFEDRLESTLQTIRRFAIVTVHDAPGGGYAIRVNVQKELEDMAKPDRQSSMQAVFTNDFPVNRTREIVGPVPLPVQWIPRGRDSKVEQKILNDLKRAFAL